ncbi:alkanesulfonate monooxygenase SsuD/methylene tetrahydromethanopterin reductase-like flavin-dependent oxidoreductase (luciferase family) [Amycolatopsis lexingtonensis]|uniref:Alkanesulfonate monooxygenase SsuD/methylene tetrahydromethanopterin reductase-like flavin-dependent oxidoreductase (Luciferase family) n=1 Tax=Amycolatopsis lexingtonensis TaxID=218822 RepID=A0ABR9ID93_9PSEU|nr:LLM class flavin-dependent oxidoreductase [Amycolatopsis lexingtonensis]MBE1501151.1 alkanesulfonate monooxygenase SsuD/methylene tetrahydromethanopterin reductase-like flavin-dependent oxidoreductase (luciferase family) [Amycolatopsis lexingtonensis]
MYAPTTSVGVRINREQPPAKLVELARQAEAAGLDEVWLVEDCFWAAGIATVATALAATSTIKVGIGVLPAVARNPAIAAMELAALAELHPGRLIGGFGHGVASWMRQIGAFPASQLAALEETLVAVRRLLAGERVSMTGRHVSLDEVELVFPPSSVPPLLAGVRRPKSLALAGAAADGTILAEPSPPEFVRTALADIAAAGPHALVTYNWLALGDRDRARRTVAESLTPGARVQVEGLPFAAELLALVDAASTVDELAAGLRPEWLGKLAICGALDECVASVRALHEAGSGSVVLLPLPEEPPERGIEDAGRVATALRG